MPNGPGPLVDPATRLGGRVRIAYEVVMALLALVVLGLIGLESTGWVHVVNVVVWGVFVVDYVVRLGLSGDRPTFLRTQWADLVSILPLDLLRIARALRVVRLGRAGRVLWRSSSSLRGILDTNGLSTILVVSAAIVLAGGLGIWLVEPGMGSLGDGIWWSVVTATTVGYGDLSPVTTVGRALAAGLMVVGIGTIGMTTGSIATYFVGRRRHDLPDHVEFVHDELERWHELSTDDRRRLSDMLDSLAAPPT